MAKKPVQTDLLQQLKNDIRSKEMGRLYIFHGEEIFLLHHYFDQVKKLLIDDLTESFNFHKLNNETFDLQSFMDAVENFPIQWLLEGRQECPERVVMNGRRFRVYGSLVRSRGKGKNDVAEFVRKPLECKAYRRAYDRRAAYSEGC